MLVTSNRYEIMCIHKGGCRNISKRREIIFIWRNYKTKQ